jgi:FlgD Ig-like domain
VPAPWLDAGEAPHYNIVGSDPMLTNPSGGDFRLLPGSPAEGYGCTTFLDRPIVAAPANALVTDYWRPGDRPGEAQNDENLFVSGAISDDSIWDADTVTVVGDLFIEEGVTLSINPDVYVQVDGHFAIEVAGRLMALGEALGPITFTSSQPNLFAIDTTTTAGAWRGLIFNRTQASNLPSELRYCHISHCKNIDSGGRGGAIYINDYDGLSLVNCTINHNVAPNGAALFCSHFAAPRVTGCLITDNYAFIGGAAVFNLNGYPKLINNTIVANFCLNGDIFHETNAIHNFISKPQLTNNIIRDNGCSYFIGGEILEGKAFYTTYNNIADGFPGEGNIDLPPLFSSGGEFPYALLDGSPCIDTGDPDTTGLTLPAADLAGNERLQNGRVDMGAFEWQSVSAVLDDASTIASSAKVALISLISNPSRGASPTTIQFTLSQSDQTRLAIYDATGREITQLADRFIYSGDYQMQWDGSDSHGVAVAAGVYYFSLSQPGETAVTGKVIRIR